MPDDRALRTRADRGGAGSRRARLPRLRRGCPAALPGLRLRRGGRGPRARLEPRAGGQRHRRAPISAAAASLPQRTWDRDPRRCRSGTPSYARATSDRGSPTVALALVAPLRAGKARMSVSLSPSRSRRATTLTVKGRGWPARKQIVFLVGPPRSEASPVAALSAAGRRPCGVWSKPARESARSGRRAAVRAATRRRSRPPAARRRRAGRPRTRPLAASAPVRCEPWPSVGVASSMPSAAARQRGR